MLTPPHLQHATPTTTPTCAISHSPPLSRSLNCHLAFDTRLDAAAAASAIAAATVDETSLKPPLRRPPSSRFVSHLQTPPTPEFSSAQIACVCRSLQLNGEGDRLVAFFDEQPCWRTLVFESSVDAAHVLIAHLFVLIHRGHNDEARDCIRATHVDAAFHDELRKLWYATRYAEEQERKKKPLGPVDKYRQRQKNPPPESISNGEKIIYSFTESQRATLVEFYRHNRYPKPHEKQHLAQVTGLKASQILNWMKNRRQRDRPTPRQATKSNRGWQLEQQRARVNSLKQQQQRSRYGSDDPTTRAAATLTASSYYPFCL